LRPERRRRDHRPTLQLRLSVVAIAALVLGASAPAGADGTREKDREALRRVLAELAVRGPLASAHVGIQVVSLVDGTVVFSRNADDLLNPASNVKLVTAAAALFRLGPDWRFETEFSLDGSVSERPRLYVRGKGDPVMTTERLYQVAGELKHLGLREISDIVLDDTWFDAERIAPGFEQETTDRPYTAPTGALSLNANAVGIYVRSAGAGVRPAVEIDPASEYFTLVNNAVGTASRARRASVSSEADGDRQRIVVRGTVPSTGEYVVWKRIDQPPLYYGHTLKMLLEQRGVRVRGKVKLGTVPERVRLVYVAQSETFDLVLKRMNKTSSNFVAEQLMKTLGAEARGAPGTTAKGVQAAEDFLEREVGIPRGSYLLRNGSGINDTNRFSAAQLARLVKTMAERFPLSPEYLSSMPIGGKDGTLRWRFEGNEVAGRLRAKTGTLENVSALGGVVLSAGGEPFAFSILVNDFSGRSAPVVQTIDAVGTALAAAGTPAGPAAAVAALGAPGPQASPAEEARTRLATYLQLGQKADRRNVPFLRTAWRSERDPAVRAALADAIYKSNPSDYLGARALLDSFSASDDVYLRLRILARSLNVETPCVSSLVTLAAEGGGEALARLVELTHAAAADERARGDLAVALSEVARTAPEELVHALQTAAPADRDTALPLLARGLEREADPDHPFWPAVRKLMGSVDPKRAAFARELETGLSQRIAQDRAPAAVPAAPPPAPASGRAAPAAAPAERPGGG
jgi:D-alanyl-D-alanine carboxypeptidase/D-alanyl-D-alanine-endopeptidase (penicillin-binding protein 4)